MGIIILEIFFKTLQQACSTEEKRSSRRTAKSQPTSRKKLPRASTLLREITQTRNNTSVSSSSTVPPSLTTLKVTVLLPNTSSLRSHTDQALLSERLESSFKKLLRRTLTSRSSLLPTEPSSHHQQNLTQVR